MFNLPIPVLIGGSMIAVGLLMGLWILVSVITHKARNQSHLD
jgi:hypothetical protein